MKIIFFGTSEFAVPALKKIAEDPTYQIAAAVTQPDMPSGRHQEIVPTPVKAAAKALGLPVLQPEKLTANILAPDADLFVVASYGKIIPNEVLKIPRLGTLNIHPSLLPKYRGPSPIQETILRGDLEAGVSIIVLDDKVDHGPILGVTKWPLLSPKVSYQQLHDGLAQMGAKLLMEVLPKYVSGELKPTPQDDKQASFTKIITREDGRIKWSDTADEIERKIRAYSNWPTAWTTFEGKRFKIFEADARGGATGAPGMILVDDFKMKVLCGKQLLAIYELQIEGGKRMTAAEFLHGQPRLDGKILI